MLADTRTFTVEALALAVRAWVQRFGPLQHTGPWELASAFSGGLLSGRLRAPP